LLRSSESKIHTLAHSVVLLASLVILPTGLAQAQAPARSFAELQARLHEGDKVQVIDRMGRRIDGDFGHISGAALQLFVHKTPMEFLETEIREVRKRRPESRWNGVLIGMGVGLIAGFVTVTSSCAGASEHDDCVHVGMIIDLPIFAAAGAGAGALIDSTLKKKHDTVFAPAVLRGHRFLRSPVFGDQLKGLRLSVSF
jgi:hypothetical protein